MQELWRFTHNPKNDLNNRERKKAMRNHPLIHGTIIIGTMNATVGNQIRDSDVDRRIISLKNV